MTLLYFRLFNLSANALNNDLLKINNWAYQWKMSFNPDPSKQAQAIIFCRKIKKSRKIKKPKPSSVNFHQ